MKKSVISFVAGTVFGATFVIYFAEKGRKIRENRNITKKTPTVTEEDDFEDDFDDDFADWPVEQK